MRLVPFVAGAALSGLAALAWLQTDGFGTTGTGDVVAPRPDSAAPAGPDLAEFGEPGGADGHGLGPLPRSLRGTSPPGGLLVDAAGALVPTPALRSLFEHFLAATGEEPPETIRARIVAALREQLPPAAARQGETLLDLYLDYRERLRELDDPQLAASADLERRLQWLRELRREIFGAETAAGLFGPDEETLRIALEQRRIASDPALDPEERRQRLEELEAQLPDTVRVAREAALAPLRLHQEEAALRASGAAASEIRALRASRLPPEAVARLEELDHSRADWEERVARYRSERSVLEADPALPPAQRGAALEALRARHFAAHELTRVRALDAAAETAR